MAEAGEGGAACSTLEGAARSTSTLVLLSHDHAVLEIRVDNDERMSKEDLRSGLSAAGEAVLAGFSRP